MIQPGDRYVYDPHTTKEELTKHWFAANMKTFVAEENGKIPGTYIRRPNHIHFGSHIANCGYMVSKDVRGQGIGKLMCEHSLIKARFLGYTGMQYNSVVSTNTAAIKLWKKN